MKRRTVLGTTGATLLAGLAGCLGGGDETAPPDSGGTPTQTPTQGAPFEHPGTLDETFATNGNYPPDDDPADGRPPAFDDPPAAPDADPSLFETLDVNGETVRLAPIDVVEAWYRRGEARFVDARGLDQYIPQHIFGAVLSTYQQDSSGGGIDGWDPDVRTVTYCTCPHHQSTLRAAGLQKAGYTNVYAIDEGFRPWFDQSKPMAGTSFTSGSQAQVAEWTVSGTVPPKYAGRYVHAAADRQYEAGPVGQDGTYELTLRLWNATDQTPVTLETPSYTVTRPVGELAAKPVDESLVSQ